MLSKLFDHEVNLLSCRASYRPCVPISKKETENTKEICPLHQREKSSTSLTTTENNC